MSESDDFVRDRGGRGRLTRLQTDDSPVSVATDQIEVERAQSWETSLV